MDVKHDSSYYGKHTEFENKTLRKLFEPKGGKCNRKDGTNCLMRSFQIWTLDLILLER